MARYLFPLLLIALGVLGLVDHDMINDSWMAMYPDDPARQAALARCVSEDGLMNRFSAAGRAACYQKYLQVELAPAAPGIAVTIPGSAPPSLPNAPPAHAVPHAPTLHTNSNQPIPH
jgi:hypothetical protein